LSVIHVASIFVNQTIVRLD